MHTLQAAMAIVLGSVFGACGVAAVCDCFRRCTVPMVLAAALLIAVAALQVWNAVTFLDIR